MLALVEQGKASNTVLIDSRPLPRFQEGTIPGAINLPYPAWDKFVDRLPKDKNQAILFFCQGPTCMMSPNSLRNAEKLGYTNVKVYPGGVPEWLEKNVGVLSPAFLQEAWIAKDIPHVLIDVRPASTVARDGFIPGAVNVPVSQIPAALATLPPAKLRAPIMVYDGDGGTAARYSAEDDPGCRPDQRQHGHRRVRRLEGGRQQGRDRYAGHQDRLRAEAAARRDLDCRVHGARQGDAGGRADPRRAQPGRGQRRHDQGCEAHSRRGPARPGWARSRRTSGSSPTAATGVRAEMAYHKLKDKGYKVNFVKADLAIKKDGSFVATPPK